MPRTPNVSTAEVLDFTGQEEQADFDLLPQALYLLRVRTAEVLESNKTGHPYVKYEAEVVDDTQGGDYRKRIVFDAIAVQGATPEKTKQLAAIVQQRLVAITGAPLKARGDARSICETIAEAIQSQTFVGKVTIQKPTKQQADELGYEAQNKIRKYFPADTWTQEAHGSRNGSKGWK